ncbi:MAG TPA: PSD1 and planctomycete cytochrome C domain-containing protein [Fimbriimonas sp.]|nr:PSD1 and planctomycete cytochrome C domain-containing protein [Fimbriimonas sp.]
MTSRSILNAVCLTAGLAGAYATTTSKPQTPPPAKVDFNRDVRPLLAQHCWPCHGQDKEALKKTGGISLDSFVGATTNHFGMQAIVPGTPDKSELIKQAATGQMPPKDSGIKPLSATEIETIKAWIKEGAPYSAHWAFIPPKMPAVPKVEDSKWARNDIDRFVLSGLEQHGIKPEPEADKRTLIRRVTLTLTGLPPTPEEVNRFLADKRSDAYERLVDGLLASPHYGENQARYWLDAVRYADTHGFHIDNERSIYPYRDWVVRAYNQDLPYNKFVLWQLAGDLLPGPTLDQQIATGYVRLNPTSGEGGAIEAEYLAKNTFDRVDTTSTVFLGLTLQCAKCHDHKYDPFTQKDYYRMYAYFDNTADTPLDGNQRNHAPVIPAPTPEQKKHLAILSLQQGKVLTNTSLASAREWAKTASLNLPTVGSWEIAGPFKGKDFDAAYATNFGPEPGGTAQVSWRATKIDLEKPQANLIGQDHAAIYLRSTLKVDQACKVDIRLGSDDGIHVWLNGSSVLDNKVDRSLVANSDKVSLNLKAGANELLIKIVNDSGDDGAFVGIGGPDTDEVARARELAGKDSLTTEQTKELLETFLTRGPATEQSTLYRKLTTALAKQNAEIPMTYVAKELPMVRPTYLLRRGQYDLPGDLVTRAIPQVFGALPDMKNNNRLGLAEWIIDPKNPLTARVMVNRIWQQHFGTGLVKSSEDFGSRGDWPTNPALLDYLACRFTQEGGSIKKLTRLIVTSAAFRQSAAVTAAQRAKDPDNALISRGPRFRLDAEVIRDVALDVSGLLVDKAGGHSDKPYQPPGLWEIIAYPISDTAHYKQDHGDALYRRSLYLFWKRTSPPPTMMLFDAPMRESCVVRRSRTNTPTQALASLNETGFFEDARNMAQRVLKTKPDTASRIDYAFRLATGRPPTAAESGVVKGFLSEEQARYRAHPKEAEETLSIGESPRDKTLPAPEHAAWTLACNMILNLDETITQH